MQVSIIPTYVILMTEIAIEANIDFFLDFLFNFSQSVTIIERFFIFFLM